MRSSFKKSLFAALPLIGTLSVGTLYFPSVVAADHPRYDRDESRMSRQDRQSFYNYLDSHWETAQQLYQNPELINRRRFIRDHDALRNWLEDHPQAADALRADPQRYLWRGRADWPDEDRDVIARMRARDLRSFENYLDSDWETAQRLYQNPELIRNRRFVRNHDELDDWLRSHPDAAAALRADPHKFLWRERTLAPADFLTQLLQRR